jgi:gas vesicle protein
MRDEKTNLLYFMAGASVGAALGILLAPASGADTRRRLSEGAGRELIGKSRERYDAGWRFAEEAAEMYDDGRRLFDDAQRSVK